MSSRHPGRSPKSDRGSCKVTDCQKPFFAKGFCSTHYMYLRRKIIDENGVRLREPQRIAKYASDAICIVDGCGDRPRSRGMCNKHMLQRDADILDGAGNQLRELLPTGRKRERDRWVSSTRDGYVVVVAPEGHPRARHDGTILEHRLIMEKSLNRYLEEWEIVHHRDGNRANNDLSNLELFDGRAESSGPGHHPGHEFDARIAAEVLLRRDDVPDALRQWLEWFKLKLSGN